MVAVYGPARLGAEIRGGGGMAAAKRRDNRPLLHRLWFGAVLAGVLIAVLAEPRAEPAPGDDAVVLAADATLGDAVRAGDRSTVRRLLALQFTYADENGRVYERKEFLSALKSLAAVPAADAKATVYGSVAMVTGHRKSAADNDTFFLDVWAKQKGAWRALTIQDVLLAGESQPAAAPERPGAPATEAQSHECKNPCQSIPYRVRSPAEQDVVNAFQAIEKASIAHDAEEWGRHVAGEFVLYRSGHTPTARSERIAAIQRQQQNHGAVTVGEVESMRLAVYGDGAAMIANHAAPDPARLPYRATRVWVKRNGQWQMVISVQTDVNTAQQH